MFNLFSATFVGVLQYIGYILLAIMILLIMITVHEFGHYTVGKIFHFKIEEFAIGFGPKLFSKKKKNGEIFSIRALPLGGYCAFAGEDKDSDEKGAFNNQKPWKRILVLVAGATMNYITALIIIIIMILSFGQTMYRVNQTADTIDQPFLVGDVIMQANGRNVYTVSDLMGAIDGKKQGDIVTYTVLREGEETEIEVALQGDANFNSVTDTDPLLIAMGVNSLTPQNVKFSFFTSIARGATYSVKIAGTIFEVLGQLLTGRLGLSAVGGTITTIRYTAEAVQSGGLNNLLMIAGFIGVNLAVFNLLPIPALDGSRIVFTVIEWIRGKPVNRKIEGVIHLIGLIVLFGFAILVDVLQLFA